jgi:hypothetical protein
MRLPQDYHGMALGEAMTWSWQPEPELEMVLAGLQRQGEEAERGGGCRWLVSGSYPLYISRWLESVSKARSELG